MIPSGVQIFVALEPVDMRFGFERLAGLARERIGYDARSGALFVFVGKRGTTTKVLFFDGSGLCLFHKKLDRGTFALPTPPAPGTTHLEVDDATLSALLDGLAIEPTTAPTTKPPLRPLGRIGHPSGSPAQAAPAALSPRHFAHWVIGPLGALEPH